MLRVLHYSTQHQQHYILCRWTSRRTSLSGHPGHHFLGFSAACGVLWTSSTMFSCYGQQSRRRYRTLGPGMQEKTLYQLKLLNEVRFPWTKMSLILNQNFRSPSALIFFILNSNVIHLQNNILTRIAESRFWSESKLHAYECLSVFKIVAFILSRSIRF